MTDQADKAKRSQMLVNRIKPILAGEGSDVQSAALADLVALWLAGHQAPEATAAELDEFREEVFQAWIKCVRDLLPVNDKIVRRWSKQ